MARTRTADVLVAGTGCLEVLSVGKGDLKLTWEEGNPEDEAKAKAVVEEMIRKGYGIFVETDVGPARVQRFSRERFAYVITELADGVELPSGPAAPKALPPGPSAEVIVEGQPKVGDVKDAPAPKRGPGRPRTRQREVPVAGSRATAVGRTAGG